jgi:hypothetical protein
MNHSRSTYKVLEKLNRNLTGDIILENNIQTIRRLHEAKVLHDISMLKLSVSMLSSCMYELMTHVEIFK